MIKLAAILLIFAQPPDTLTLEACYDGVAENWPTLVRSELGRSISALQSDNLGSRYLPGVSVRGQAAYHSSVVTFPFDVPGVTNTGIPKDQYSASLDVDQLIYDGGEISARKRLADIGGNLSAIQTDVELHEVRTQLNRLFFEALSLQEQATLTTTLIADTEARLKIVRAGIQNGTALRSDADVLEAELERVSQDLRSTVIRKRGYLSAIAELTGRSIPPDVVIAAPFSVENAVALSGRRPELDLFDEQARQLEELADLTSAARRPKLSGFGQAGIGRPPDLDFFTDEFEPFFVVGLRLNWRFWDWSHSGREKQMRQIERDVLRAEEDAFSRQIAAEAEIQKAEIVRLDSLIASDDRIIQLRDRVVADAASRLENGAITATDYLIERNQTYRARLQRSIHKIQRAAAQVKYATTIGASI